MASLHKRLNNRVLCVTLYIPLLNGETPTTDITLESFLILGKVYKNRTNAFFTVFTYVLKIRQTGDKP